jgi:hypothetical protein
MIPPGFICHHTTHRLRIRVPSMRGNTDYFDMLSEVFSQITQMTNIQVNPRTASLLLEHEGIAQEIIQDVAEKNELFILQNQPGIPKMLMLEQTTSNINLVDAGLKNLTQGYVDLRSIVFLGLVAFAIRQLQQGQIMAPATSLLWYAGSLLNPLKNKE